MKKIVVVATLAILVYLAISSVAALLLSGAIGELPARFGVGPMSWWQCFCALLCVSIIGGAFGYVSAAAKSDR